MSNNISVETVVFIVYEQILNFFHVAKSREELNFSTVFLLAGKKVHGKGEQKTRLSWPAPQLAGEPPFLPQPTLQKEHGQSSHQIDHHKTHHLTCLCPLRLCPPFSCSKMFIDQSKASHPLQARCQSLYKDVVLEHPSLRYSECCSVLSPYHHPLPSNATSQNWWLGRLSSQSRVLNGEALLSSCNFLLSVVQLGLDF